MKWDEAPVVEETPAAKAEESGPDGKRYLGLIARALVNGVSQPASMISDTEVSGPAGIPTMIRKALGVPSFQSVVEGGMNKAGLPQPEGSGEKIVSSAISALPMAAAGPGGISRLFSGMAAGAAGSAAKEAEAPGAVQVIASLLAGAAPQALGKVTGAVGRAVQPYVPGQADAVKARVLSEVVGDRRPEVMRALSTGTNPVPGANATAAEMAVPAGSTELSGLQSLLANRYDPSGFRDIQQAQGAARNTWAGYPLTPEGQAVPGDIARSAANTSMASQGGTRARELVGSAIDPLGTMPNILSRPLMIMRFLAEKAKGQATPRILGPLAQDMKDPQEILRLLQNAPPSQQGQLLEALKAYISGTTSGLVENQ